MNVYFSYLYTVFLYILLWYRPQKVWNNARWLTLRSEIFLNWDARFTRDSNPSLQHDLHAPQARALPITLPLLESLKLLTAVMPRRNFCTVYIIFIEVLKFSKRLDISLNFWMSNYANIQLMDQSNFRQNNMSFKKLLCLLLCMLFQNKRLRMSNLMK